ncbi:MAG: hypothetical protein PHW38_02960 [Candidatus Cloacimonetes bacterium]
MDNHILSVLLVLLSLFPISLIFAQSLVVSANIELQPERWEYPISSSPIINGSENVYADTLLLLPGRDYQIDYKNGILKLVKFPETSTLKVDYIQVPPSLTERYYLYEMKEPSDSLFINISPPKPLWQSTSNNLLVSGSKTFALTFSEEEAFDLKQSLYVNLNGELGHNVNIAAQLSDSQSKLTPEGDSKELSNLDKVFIRVYGKQYEIAMGDLDWQFDGTRYINYKTTIEGLNAWYKDKHFIQAGFTASSGKPASIVINIIDGKQGPYYLNPTGYQSTYLIIAGSEKIYCDGKLLERGTDYYIDYSEGSIMFRTMVVSSNLVNAYFQYADEFYNQSTYFNSSTLNLSPGLSLSHHLIHQVDAKEHPLLYDFTSADLDSLRKAGDSVVWSNGIVEVEPGMGSYIQRMSSDGIIYYEYAPYDSLAHYNIVFSFVGSGNGDYEEFSSGKFRYVGTGMGAWLPQKRLIPPVKRTNADLLLSYANDSLELGMEGIFTLNDKNTFSAFDDSDNQSGILYAYGNLKKGDIGKENYLGLDFEKRWENSFLFSQDTDISQNYDFALLEQADSLSQYQINLTLGSRAWYWWNPELMLRYRKVDDQFSQRALRFLSHSPAKGLIPALDIHSTVSLQKYDDASTPSSVMQYHDFSSEWISRWVQTKLIINYNGLEYNSNSPLYISNRYYKINPQLTVGDTKISLTQFSYIWDNSDMKENSWNTISQSQTYNLKHSTSTLNHTVNLDFTHRNIEKENEIDNPKSKYDLINLRNSNSFLKQAIMILGNYQLNQTEFFPKIRELEYVGNGLGLYDSTGVYTPDGDWDYVYITSDQGTLSTEINGQLSFYLKPGNYLPKWNRVHSDIILQATEQSPNLRQWQSYLFLPGYVFDEDLTIFGKQSIAPTIWIDIIPNRILGCLNYQYNRTLDKRYQIVTRTTESIFGAEMDLKQYGTNNYSFKYELNKEKDTRYMSSIRANALYVLIQHNFSSNSIGTLNFTGSSESGSQLSNTEKYKLQGIGLEPGFRGSWGKKGRLSASIGIRYNQHSGSEFLTFLPEKRGGLLINWNISTIYRLNNYCSITLEYDGNAYPQDRVRHTLKMEFKAEL